MKALILTRVPVSDDDRALVNQSSILKIAVNNAKFDVDYRVFHEWDKWDRYVELFGEPLITAMPPIGHIKHSLDRFHFLYKNAGKLNSKNPEELYFWQGSITSATDFVLKAGATELLLVADNTVHEKAFQQCMRELFFVVNKEYANVYQFSAGNFSLPVKSIKDFVNAG